MRSSRILRRTVRPDSGARTHAHPRLPLPVLAAAALLLLPGCTAVNAEAQSTGASPLTLTATPLAPSSTPSSSPLPSPTGTWTPAASDAATGPASAAPQPTRSADLAEQVVFDTRIGVALESVKTLQVTAETPGEVTGPAVRMSVVVDNDSDAPLDVSSAVVTLAADGDDYGISTTAGDPSPLEGIVPAGGSASGTYVFMLDPAEGREVTIHVTYAAGEPVAVFTGRTA